jgi:ParB-like chromosome segregation protein Spo0J
MSKQNAGAMRIEYMALTELAALRHSRNPKDHDIGALAKAINRFGYVAPVTVDERTGLMVAGHGRIDTLTQMKAQGRKAPARIEARDGEWYVPVVRGIAFNSDAEVEAYLIADNRLTELGGWHNSELATLLQDLERIDASLLEATGYDADDVQALLDDLERAQEIAEQQEAGASTALIDKAQELAAKYGVERGKAWQVGRHRVMCGDAFNPADRETLLQGAAPDLLHTDPPYGINAVQEGKAGQQGTGRGSTRSTAPSVGFKDKAPEGYGSTHRASKHAYVPVPVLYPVIEGDDGPFDPRPLLGLAPITILWGANNFADKLPLSRAWFVWDKREGITRNDFSDCELAWQDGAEKGASRVFHHLWNGLHKASQHGESRRHPTEKPVALFQEIGQRYAAGGAWLDLFAGSGAQVVAAERAGATCYAMEIEPLYVAVILDRLEQEGLLPELTDNAEIPF